MDLEGLLRGYGLVEIHDVIAAGAAQRVAHPLGTAGTELSEGILVFAQRSLTYLSDSEQVTVPYTDINWCAVNNRETGPILVLRRQDDWMAFRLEQEGHARNAEYILLVQKAVSIRPDRHGWTYGAMWNPEEGWGSGPQPLSRRPFPTG